MEFRVLVLLLLSGAAYSGKAEEDFVAGVEKAGGGVGGGAHGTEGFKLMRKWHLLNVTLSKLSKGVKGDKCTATPAQTAAYFLLSDLLDFHQVDGIIAHGFPRRKFYEKEFKELEKVEHKVVVCRHDVRLVCLVDKCVSCSDLGSEAGEVDAKLVEACGLEGTGGKGAETEAPKEGELPQPGSLGEPPKKECDDGWLTAGDMRGWHLAVTQADWAMKSRSPCTYNFELQGAWYLLDHVVRKYAGEGELEAELADYWDFYEERLWMFRGGHNLLYSFCKRAKEGDGAGPLVCGMDAVCVDCNFVKNATYSVKPPKELSDGCEVQGRLEGRVKREDRCPKATTTTTTTTTGTSVNATEESSSGVRMGGKSRVLIAAAILLIGFIA